MKTFPMGRRAFRSFEELLVFEIMAVLEQLVGLDYTVVQSSSMVDSFCIGV